jgi:hypothetical protein
MFGSVTARYWGQVEEGGLSFTKFYITRSWERFMVYHVDSGPPLARPRAKFPNFMQNICIYREHIFSVEKKHRRQRPSVFEGFGPPLGPHGGPWGRPMGSPYFPSVRCREAFKGMLHSLFVCLLSCWHPSSTQ